MLNTRVLSFCVLFVLFCLLRADSSFARLSEIEDLDDGAMGIDADEDERRRFTFHAEFNRSAAFGVGRRQCETFRWAHGGKKRLIHFGPAILGADKDIAKALGRLRRSVSLLHLGMRPQFRSRDGLWSPCINLAFVMCAIRGWLPKQGGPHFYLATRADQLGKRCRPCSACNTNRSRGQFFDECTLKVFL